MSELLMRYRGISEHGKPRNVQFVTKNQETFNRMIKEVKPKVKENCILVKDIYSKFNSFIGGIENKVETVIEKKGETILTDLKSRIGTLQDKIKILQNRERIEENKKMQNSIIEDQNIAIEWFKGQLTSLANSLIKMQAQLSDAKKQINIEKQEKQLLQANVQKKSEKYLLIKKKLTNAHLLCDRIVQQLPNGLTDTLGSEYRVLFKKGNNYSHQTEINCETKSNTLIKNRNRSYISVHSFEEKAATINYDKKKDFIGVNSNALYSEKLKEKDKIIINLKKKLLDAHHGQINQYQQYFIECIDATINAIKTNKIPANTEKINVINLLFSREDFLQEVYNVIFAKEQKNPYMVFGNKRQSTITFKRTGIAKGKVENGKLQIGDSSIS